MTNANASVNVKPIENAIAELDAVIEWARSEGSPVGYFATLYRLVTRTIHDTVARGDYFDDDARMVTFDVRFAGRYLAAYKAWRDGEPTTEAWAIALEATKDTDVTLMQHLMLGINAHMNLDLPVVAASLAAHGSLASLHADFLRINEILGSLVPPFEEAVGKVSPRLAKIESFAPKLEGKLFDFGLIIGRDVAWHDAESVVEAGQNGHDARVESLDASVARLGAEFRHLPEPLAPINRWIGEEESRDVAANLDLLGAIT